MEEAKTTTLIKVECTDQVLRLTQTPTIASGGVKEDTVEFAFDNLWDGFNLTAVFYCGENEVYHVGIVDNRCIVPREVLANPGYFYLGVMGVKDGVTRTTNVLSYRVEAGAITEGVKPPEPTPSIYEQILASVKYAEQIAQSVRDDADAGKFNGAKGEKGDTGAQGVQGVQGIQGVKGEPGKDGVSPSVEISRSGDTTTIAITDASGVHTAGIKDGSKGDKGDKGDPGSDANVTAQNIEAALGYAPVKDVQVAGTSVMDGGVANVPIAQTWVSGERQFGVMAPSIAHGLYAANGLIQVYPAETENINGRALDRPIVPNNLDYAVKAAMCDGKGAAWTAAEQKAARERMGISGEFELIEEITLSEDVMNVAREAFPDGTPYDLRSLILVVDSTNVENRQRVDGWAQLNAKLPSNRWLYIAPGVFISTDDSVSYFVYRALSDGSIDSYFAKAANATVTGYTTERNFIPRNVIQFGSHINDFLLYSTSTAIPANTKISIYGVRA